MTTTVPGQDLHLLAAAPPAPAAARSGGGARRTLLAPAVGLLGVAAAAPEPGEARPAR